MKLFVLFDEDGSKIYYEQTNDLDMEKFLDGSRKAIEQFRYNYGLPANPMFVNLVVYDEEGLPETDEFLWYSFIMGKFYDSRKKAEEEEEI